MNRPAPLRSPVALLTALALLCGALAAVLALAVPAGAAAVQGGLTLQGASGGLEAAPLATGVTTTGGCPAPAAADKPYVGGRLVVVNPESRDAFAPLADLVAEGPLSGGAFTRTLTTQGHTTLKDALLTFRTADALDGRYELRLFCRTERGAETDAYFSAMIEVTAGAWAPVAQQATVVEVVSDPELPTVGGQARLTATVQPRNATGTVTFQKFVAEELVDIATVDVADGRAETTLTALTAAPDGLPIVAAYAPADPEAFTVSFTVFTLYVNEATTGPSPTPTDTTPTPTGTGTPTGTATPTDDPTGTGSPEPTDTPSETPSDTTGPGDSPSPTGTGDSGTSGGSGGSGGSGVSGGDSGGSGGTSGGGSTGGTSPQGGGGSLAATGSTAASAALGSLALCLLGAAAVIQTRRRKGGARP
ncbi:hypothetical protein [Streptomyces sp. NPDC002057]|uniref:hypothetical protein n=1 Tax=Streptomyces sp. NPDC002057 TaxID=3154664 RepID=UPI0033324BE5